MFYSDTFLKGEFTLKHETLIDLNTFSNNLIVNFLQQVKLADVLGKFIIPVNFLENWPPKCLAIQFATTQYIDWKTQTQINAGTCIFSNTELRIENSPK